MVIRETDTKYGPRFTAIYRTVGGKQKRAGTFASKKEAESAYLAAMSKVKLGVDPSSKVQTVYPDQVAGGETVAAYAERWLPNHITTKGRPLSPHARRSYEANLNAHIISALGHRPVPALTTQEIATWLRKLEKQGKSHTVVTKVKCVLSAMLRTAAEEGLLPYNVARGIELNQVAKRRRKALTLDQYAKLMVELGDHWGLMTDFITTPASAGRKRRRCRRATWIATVSAMMPHTHERQTVGELAVTEPSGPDRGASLDGVRGRHAAGLRS